MSIWDEIQNEREYQDKKWGGVGHDDQHTSHDWVSYLARHIGKAVQWPFSAEVFRVQMVRVAALAVAAIEWIDRNKGREREYYSAAPALQATWTVENGILSYLKDHKLPVTADEMARKFQISASLIGEVLNRLKGWGLVEAVPEPETLILKWRMKAKE